MPNGIKTLMLPEFVPELDPIVVTGATKDPMELLS
jgi:hypothetical protein